MENKYLVPGGMLDAVMADSMVVAALNGKAQNLTTPVALEVMSRALKWLAENPIVSWGLRFYGHMEMCW